MWDWNCICDVYLILIQSWLIVHEQNVMQNKLTQKQTVCWPQQQTYEQSDKYMSEHAKIANDIEFLMPTYFVKNEVF